ncbi:unnamed protein product [Ilex paraguariensis]|uniref:non-specific serine/threonine protein kinase n=1 Tax=Ilex paraguariensis TaxID=185542 RepID=A0ABC8UIS3_9AQUA
MYKGVLDQDGTIVAVKVLNLLRPGASRSFLAECEALRNIRHRNLVKVVTACSGVDYKGNDFKALVFEYMVNGNVQEWLHPIQGEDEVNEETRNLGLLQRLNIAIDIACALDYLHNHWHTRIIHCDLKPNNILLNNEMTAHVGDFGLVRFLLNASCSTFAHQTSRSIGLRGSIVYAALEYGMGSEPSIHGDVYSYDIILLKMFTGKRLTDEMFKKSLNIHNYVKMTLPGRITNVANPRFLQYREEGETSINRQHRDQSHKIQECLISIFGIGLACSQESPSEPLDTSDILAKLLVVRNTFMETNGIHEQRSRIGIQS